jgi:7-cyano-7-deazaguanine synthase in queuosine biosynthesis
MKLVRYIGEKGCLDAGYHAALADVDRVIIDTCPRRANVVLRFQRNGHPVRVPLSPVHRDFLDLAAGVYIADELVSRRSADDGWTRAFSFLIPVRAPDLWTKATPLLSRCLSGLSGDQYDFEWVKRTGIVSLPRSRQRLPRACDVVCLFSGGIDSLLGAWHLLAAGRQVLLVGHQADGLTAAAQTELARELASLFPGKVSLVQTRISRSGSARLRYHLPPKCEETHRPRSFLFLSLAVCVASAAGAGEIHIPENGLIALNPPLQVSRAGTLSTRTAHPLYLSRFRVLAGALGVFDGPVKNPFVYQSKTDMLTSVDPRLRPLLVRSVSCARPSRYQDRGVRHCGYCVPCLFRRAAMARAGLDLAADYAFDVFSDFRAMTPTTQADFKALVPFAAKVADADESALERVVLSQGAFSPGIGGDLGPRPADDYRPWTEMLRRWAVNFLRYVDEAASSGVKRAVGFQPAAGPAKGTP